LRKPAVDVTVDDWDEVININLRGSYLTAAEFARRLIAGKRTGSIANIGSTHGLAGFPNLSVYGISKAGLHHMTRMLAIEWADHGIQVNAIAPGATETPSRAEVFRDPATRNRLLDKIPTHQFTTTDEVAAAALYLVSPHAKVVTGHILVLDGGLTVYWAVWTDLINLVKMKPRASAMYEPQICAVFSHRSAIRSKRLSKGSSSARYLITAASHPY
jgi:NAD(P)-dependent dehydrogenase (short-subunit alcohol dehydrogenase family)